MGLVVAGLVMVAALSLFNLALSLRMARQLRTYAEIFDGLEPAEVGGSTRLPGTALGPFETTAVDGTTVDVGWFSESTLVGFFSPGCPACRDLIPAFVAAAAGRRALAVVESGPEGFDDHVSDLSGHATVVAGDAAAPVVASFGVHGFPAVCTVDGQGVITATGTHLVNDRRAVPA